MKKRWTIGLIGVLICSGCATSPESRTTASVNTESVTVTEKSTADAETTIESTTVGETTVIDTTIDDKTDIETTISDTTEISETTWSPASLKDGLSTAVEYDKRYNAVVNSAEDAWSVIKMYGDMQKKNYSNPEISEIETRMENEFEIAYVTLGEMDVETATDIYNAFKYMYSTYPELMGTLTDFTLGNFTWNGTAETRTFEFVTDSYKVPIVLKREIIINAESFLNRDSLLASCRYQEETGYWPKNASISMIIVHELGHQLLEIHNADIHGFSGYYVTKENENAYRDYAQESFSWNQAEIKRIIAEAYTEWSKLNDGTEEDFMGSISGYAKGIQSDGGISYAETFAEAVADIYANGENAAEASKLILSTLNK